jgi:prepilin-type N-terminal cleavage/methylation domain-containing protein
MKRIYFSKIKKGVTLVEVLVAMFIFSVMAVSMMSTFVTLIHRRMEIRVMQQQTEEFALAESYVAKKIRMSDTATCSISQCTLVGGAGNTSFSFSGGSLFEGSSIIAKDVSGGFVKSSASIPVVTLHLMAVGKPATSVQTSVSLRSY